MTATKTRKEKTKICIDCSEEKPLKEFNLAGKGGRRVRCSPCRYAHRKRNGELMINALYGIRSRSRKHHDIGDITPAEYIEIAWHTHCVYCGEPRKQDEKLTVDHIIPVRLGGTGAFENVVPACRSCNSAKSDRALIEYYFTSDTCTDKLFRDFIRYTAEKADRDESEMVTLLYDWYTAESFGYFGEGLTTVDEVIEEKKARQA